MAANSHKNKGFSAPERAAMKERAKELAAEHRAEKKRSDGERDVLEAISAMTGSDKTMARRIHRLVLDTRPDLWPKMWYGMPAYAKDGKVVCFFQSAKKFEARYASFGFNDTAKLDDGNMWPTSFALTSVGSEEELRIS